MRTQAPLLCLVTDRRSVGQASHPSPPVPWHVRGEGGEGSGEKNANTPPPSADGLDAALDALIARIAEASEAGIDLVQIREPDLPAADLFELVVRAVTVVEGSPTRIVVNDRLDVALAAAAHGVHLRGTSVDAARVRAVAPAASGFLVGRSVHSVEEAVAAEAAGGLDYLILGTMFPTRSKPAHHPLAGTAALRAAASACRIPVLAIGGITLDNLHDVARSGAAGIAAIGLFLGRHAPGEATGRHLRDVVADIRQIFAGSR